MGKCDCRADSILIEPERLLSSTISFLGDIQTVFLRKRRTGITAYTWIQRQSAAESSTSHHVLSFVTSMRQDSPSDESIFSTIRPTLDEASAGGGGGDHDHNHKPGGQAVGVHGSSENVTYRITHVHSSTPCLALNCRQGTGTLDVRLLQASEVGTNG